MPQTALRMVSLPALACPGRHEPTPRGPRPPGAGAGSGSVPPLMGSAKVSIFIAFLTAVRNLKLTQMWQTAPEVDNRGLLTQPHAAA